MSDLAELPTAIDLIDVEVVTADALATVYDRLCAYIERGRAMRADLEAKMLAYCERTGEAIVIGPKRYYAGYDKQTKCRDQAEALATLLESYTPVEVGRLFLASGAFKHGAIKKELPDQFARLFEVENKPVLKDGVATKEKKLLVADERFTG